MNRSAVRRGTAEFFLIVSGVLVALGAENLLAKMAERSLAESYISDLQVDLVTDSATSNAWVALSEGRIRTLTAMLDDLDGTTRIEGAERTLAVLFFAQINPSPNFARSTFDDLISTGNIRLLDVAVRRRLHSYRSLLDKAEGVRVKFGDERSSFSGLIPGALVAHACVRAAPTPACVQGAAAEVVANLTSTDLAALNSWRSIPGLRAELQASLYGAHVFIGRMNELTAGREALAVTLRE